jgi:hypothetical protein
MLLTQYRSLLECGWQLAFPQARLRRRALEHAVASVCVLGRRTISRTLSALGRSDCDWSADYKLFSRARWEPERLFDPVIDEYQERYPKGPIVAAIDDTNLRKTGKKIPGTGWLRDPLSPPFHLNLRYAMRFLQVALLFPHYQEGKYPPRGVPVRFQAAPPLKKPGKRASEEQLKAFRQLKKTANLSTQSLALLRELRTSLDERGGTHRSLLMVADGSFANRTMFRAQLDRTVLLARCRKDARLCFPAPPGQRRKYDRQRFTPEQIRQQPERPWAKVKVFLGGKQRFVKYKEVKGVLWRRGAGQQPLRLLVIAPVPYKLSLHSRLNYRQPAYFLTQDLTTAPKLLVQACFDRWQIEVNHRDEKDLLGVGQAQVRNPQSVPRHPALAVASYSLLLLAALKTSGPGRTDDYLPQPKWRKHNSQRPSILDLVSLLRSQCNETSVSHFLHPNFTKNLVLYADT